MFGSIAAKAKICRFSIAVILVPSLFARTFPALRDRIADKNEFMTTLFRQLDAGFMALLPPGFTQPVGRRGCDVLERD